MAAANWKDARGWGLTSFSLTRLERVWYHKLSWRIHLLEGKKKKEKRTHPDASRVKKKTTTTMMLRLKIICFRLYHLFINEYQMIIKWFVIMNTDEIDTKCLKTIQKYHRIVRSLYNFILATKIEKSSQLCYSEIC